MYVYRLRRPAPRAYLATSLKPVDTEEAINTRAVPEFDMSREALIDEASMAQVRGAYARADGETGDRRVTIVKYSGGRVEIEVETTLPGVAVLHDLYYPGWSVTVDGQVRPVLRANMLFRGVEVPAGRHTIVFEYEPLSFANLKAALKSALRIADE